MVSPVPFRVGKNASATSACVLRLGFFTLLCVIIFLPQRARSVAAKKMVEVASVCGCILHLTQLGKASFWLMLQRQHCRVAKDVSPRFITYQKCSSNLTHSIQLIHAACVSFIYAQNATTNAAANDTIPRTKTSIRARTKHAVDPSNHINFALKSLICQNALLHDCVCVCVVYDAPGVLIDEPEPRAHSLRSRAHQFQGAVVARSASFHRNGGAFPA